MEQEDKVCSTYWVEIKGSAKKYIHVMGGRVLNNEGKPTDMNEDSLLEWLRAAIELGLNVGKL